VTILAEWSSAPVDRHVCSRKVTGVTVVGVRGHLVAVEAQVGRGLPSLTLTGLPGAGVQDARDRIRPAVESAGLEWPLRRVVVNLSPGTLRKEGPGLDLPVAMGVLAATAQVPSARRGRPKGSGVGATPPDPSPHSG
jgi:hypothetical protein